MKKQSCCLASVVLALASFGAPEAPPSELTWRQTVEADWLRQEAKRRLPPEGSLAVTREEDAAGGVDGIKDGKWGFHTAHEANPWWQVDLGATSPLDRLVIYNRCDAHGARNSTLRLSVSDDAQHFRHVYQHDGGVFHGFTDRKPLVIALTNVQARLVRLSLPGTSYFHLDEVEIYAAGDARNLALGKPATQSSTSEWSVRRPQLPTTPPLTDEALALTIERGLKLAASQKRLGRDVSHEENQLAQVREEARALRGNHSGDEHAAARRALYVRARWAIRRMALGNPRLNFDSLLFVKRAPTRFPHMSDQHYGWWSRPGGGIYTLEGFQSDTPRSRCLTADWPPGNFTGPDISFDGKQVLFAYARHFPELADMEKAEKERLPEAAFYHLYEMNVDGSGLRQLTRGRYDDFDGRYLPNGDIAFLSTRKGLALQTTPAFSESTQARDLPDSYVRCGGNRHRPVPVFTLHAMDAQGRHFRPLSAFENFEWTPSVAHDGRLWFTRWDYIDRFNGHFFSLWSANQDGTHPQLVYGNYTVKPQVVLEARSVPGSSKLVFTACAHHSITGGSLCLLDRRHGTEFEPPLTRLTPDVCFPETEGWPGHYYAHPWPLSEEYFLVGWADAKLPPHRRVEDHENPVNAMGIYLYDAFGNLELLHRDPEISSAYPMPVAPRARPVTQPSHVDWRGPQEGRFLVQDVTRGLAPFTQAAVKAIRIVAVPPKVQLFMNNPVLGVSAEDPGKYVLGTAPVEADGSAHFRVPSGVPVFFQALDEHGLAVQTMRSLTYLMPGQTLACVGCHEHRDSAPPLGRPARAALSEPARLRPAPDGAWPLRFDRLVQPVLDRHCVSCHRPDSDDPRAATLDLTATNAWRGLLTFGGDDLRKWAFERDRSLPGQGVAANSQLWKLLHAAPGHYDVRLDPDSRARLTTWLDTYAQRLGHFSEEQARELEALRKQWAGLLLPDESAAPSSPAAAPASPIH